MDDMNDEFVLSCLFRQDSTPTHTFLLICMYVCMCVCMYVCMYACVYLCIYIYIYVFMYVCMYVCAYVCMHVCMYACMCVFIYIHIYIYIYIYVCMYVCMYILAGVVRFHNVFASWTWGQRIQTDEQHTCSTSRTPTWQASFFFRTLVSRAS